MKRTIAIMAILAILGMVAAMPCRGDYQYDNEEMRVFEGNVVNVDTSRSILTVKGIDQIDFPISSDTKLQRDAFDIKLSDISTKDYVTVQYYRKGKDSRVPSKVLMVTVEYGPETQGE